VRRGIAIGAGLATAVVLAVLAGSAASSDIYITGQVTKRVAGKNAALVRIAWDYKCLGEDGGDYEWSLKVVREDPLPRKTQPLGSGTSERGEKITQLTPGRYLPKSEPYFCETTRGQGFEKPELGGQFTVPDYCAWKVSSVRGLVQHQQGTAVKAARPGSSVAAGDVVVTPRSGKAVLRAAAGDGTTTLAGGSELKVDGKYCPAKAGWKLWLADGGVTVAVPKGAAPKASFTIATKNATVTAGSGARWKVEYAKRRTKVSALAGKVRVAGKVLKPGQTTTV
jgi:FecR protein